jgi:hypothetical protein
MEATIRLGNLSELKLMLGQITKAVQDAKLSVNYTNSSDDTFQRRLNLTTLANVMFHAGKAKEAYKLFRKAETMQVESQPQYTLLYSVPGFHYCDLLLAPTERAAWQCLLQFEISSSELRTATTTCHAVKQRAIQTFKWAKEDEFLLDIALNHLNLGWTALYDVILKKSKPTEAIFHLTEALNGFRRAGMIHHIPRGLLSCALLRFVEDDTEGCQADLDEARQIAERGSMRLYMADVLLHRGRLFHDKAALAKAARLIDECGYHRRDEELADAQVAAKNW